MKTRRILNSIIGFLYLMSGSNLYGQDILVLPADQPVSHVRISSEQQGSSSYTVKQGDSLGRILRDTFKLPDEIIFSPQTKSVLQDANPHLLNLNDLRAGEQLIVPGDLLRQPQAISGSVKKTESQQHTDDLSLPPPSGAPPAYDTGMPIKKGPVLQHTAEPSYFSESENIPIHEKTIAAGETLNREKKIRKLLSSFARAFGGVDNASCEKKLDIEASGAFTLDCSKSPLYEFPWGKKIILDYGERLPPVLQKIITSAWSQTEIVSVSDSATGKTVLDKVISVCGLQKLETGNSYVIKQNDTQFMVSGDWIVFKETENKNFFVISIDEGSSLPVPLKNYLAKQGVNFVFLADNLAADCPTAEISFVQAVDRRTDPAAFTDMVLDLAGISYQRNVRTKLIPRHEVGITLEMSSDRKFLLHGKPCFIVFKNVSENISSLFQNQGYKILHIDRSERLSSEAVQNLLNFLGIKNTVPTISFQHDYSNTTAIKISVSGFLLQTKQGDFLLTNTTMDTDTANYITSLHIKIVNF